MASKPEYIYNCGCPIRADMTAQQLIKEIYEPDAYCSSLTTTNGVRGWICPNLDSEYRRALREQASRIRLNKTKIEKMKREGIPDDEIMKRLKKVAKRGPKSKNRHIILSKTNFRSFYVPRPQVS